MLAGSIDGAGREGMRGWVRDPAFPDLPVSLLITCDGRLLERVVADRHRRDLEQAGIGHGGFGFDVAFHPPLLPTRSWLIHVRSEAEGEDLPGSPIRIVGAGEFDDAAQRAFAAVIGEVGSAAELDERIGFLTTQRDRLLEIRAGRRKAGPTPGGPQGRLPARALVVGEQLPEPGRDDGARALVSHMKSLQRLGYDVTFAASRMAAGNSGTALGGAGIAVCGPPWSGSVEEVLRREAGRFDVVYLRGGVVAAGYAMLVRQHQPRARIIYSVAELRHLRLARQAQHEGRADLAAEARRAGAQDVLAARLADAIITHSSAEAALIRQVVPADKVHTIAWSVPCRSSPVQFSRRSGMAFIGTVSHAPSAAAARRLRDELMPLLRSAAPEIGWRFLGHDLPGWLQAPEPWFAPAGPGLVLEDVFDRVRLTLALPGFAAGLHGDVMESLAAGMPCVCSPTAAEGLDLPGALRELIVANSAAAVTAIVRLHRDEAYNTRMSALAATFAATAFSESALDRAMRDVVAGTQTAGDLTP